MAHRDSSIFTEIFNISHPWTVRICSYSKEDLSLHFRIDYTSFTMKCPVCGVDAAVINKDQVTWNSSAFFGYKIKMTAYIPIIGFHNPACRVDKDQSVLTNSLLLDLIVRQQDASEPANPLQYLFSAVQVPAGRATPKARSHHAGRRVAAQPGESGGGSK